MRKCRVCKRMQLSLPSAAKSSGFAWQAPISGMLGGAGWWKGGPRKHLMAVTWRSRVVGARNALHLSVPPTDFMPLQDMLQKVGAHEGSLPVPYWPPCRLSQSLTASSAQRCTELRRAVMHFAPAAPAFHKLHGPLFA